ncbi:hypothetical protein WA026_011839 [Henosepilachna vigintioctopunctata]|uniref:Reverse transcriptase domain-containing protein n=1 Tax=Henosepilachna vigintioctopunctata TaxID=420089 RepID=A0AAW1UDJ8_9CUCU
MVEIGIPQGSVLDPLLFMVFFYDLSDYPLAPCLSITVSNIDLSCLMKSGDKIDYEAEGISENKLTFNAGKTILRLFPLRLNTVNIDPDDYIKFLSVFIDVGLPWKTCESVVRQACTI